MHLKLLFTLCISELLFDVYVLWGLWYGIDSWVKCIVFCEFYGVLVLDVVKYTIKIYTLYRTIFRFISISQEKKGNVTICNLTATGMLEQK